MGIFSQLRVLFILAQFQRHVWKPDWIAGFLPLTLLHSHLCSSYVIGLDHCCVFIELGHFRCFNIFSKFSFVFWSVLYFPLSISCINLYVVYSTSSSFIGETISGVHYICVNILLFSARQLAFISSLSTHSTDLYSLLTSISLTSPLYYLTVPSSLCILAHDDCCISLCCIISGWLLIICFLY